MELPPISLVPKLGTEDRMRILDVLFEPSVPLHTLSLQMLAHQEFSSYYDLIAAVGVQLTELASSSSSSDTEWLHSILSAHPRLGAKKVDSAQSQAEQAQLQGGSQEEAEKLTTLNTRYEEAFPGLRYVTFVAGRPRPIIMEDMQMRIQRGDKSQEELDAIKAMCDIAADRARETAPLQA